MKNIKILLTIMVLWVFGSCSSSNNQNAGSQNTGNSQSDNPTTYDDDEPEGMEWGDPDVEPESSGVAFYIKYKGNLSEKNANCKDFYMFLTTTDNKQFYLYDDEANYGGYVLHSYIVFRSVFNNGCSTETSIVKKNMKNITPWLGCIMDLPKIETLPKDIKKYLLKLWYDFKEKDIYTGKRGYGYQSYKIDATEFWSFGSMSGTKEKRITFRRYEKKPGDGFDEIPDESIMIRYTTVEDILSI